MDSDDSHDQPDIRPRPPQNFWTRPAFLFLYLLLGLVVSVSILISVPYMRRQAALDRIEELGGMARVQAETPPYLRNWFGDSSLYWFIRVPFVDLSNTNVNDNDLQLLQRLPELEILYILGSPQTTDEGVAALQQAIPDLIVQRPGGTFLGVGGRPTRTVGPTGTMEGYFIDDVRPDSGAANGGIKVGDVLMKLDGAQVRDFNDLVEFVSKKHPGDEVHAELLRHGAVLELDITLSEWK